MNYPKDPFYQPNSKILILGFNPSEKSDTNGFYYSSNNNRFWELISTAYDEHKPITQTEKELFLLKHGIALWDITYHRVTIKEIKQKPQELMNPIDKLINQTDIKYVFCNGRDAYQLFNGYIRHNLNKTVLCILLTQSSSNANGKQTIRRLEWNSIAIV